MLCESGSSGSLLSRTQRGVHEREQAHLDAVARAAARAKLDKQFEANRASAYSELGTGPWRGEGSRLARRYLQRAHRKMTYSGCGRVMKVSISIQFPRK